MSGFVPIVGVANSPNFLAYYLDASGGAARVTLGSSQNAATGVLSSWDTRAVPNGPYVLRLVVQDSARGTMIATARVTVKN